MPDGADEDALVARVAARDAQAFRVLVDANATALHRLAYRMLGDSAAAEDVAQEALLRLWEHASRWEGKGVGARAWLKRVATNLCLDRLRRARFVSGEEVPERADDSPLADARIDEDRMARMTRQAIGALPDRQRAAIVLTYYEELSNLDAAAALDMNIKAFESLLLRARGALKRTLAGKGWEAAA
jgi:RNA polymerase sigma-70 factor (ECF subfamily)